MGSILRQLEALGPRWTGGSGQVECGHFSWFEGNRLPKDDKLAALAQIRRRLGQIRQAIAAKLRPNHDYGTRHAPRDESPHAEREEYVKSPRPQGLERLDWLIATIDWVTLYDAAALQLYSGGPVAKLIAEAQRLQRAGDSAGAAHKAREARRLLESSGLDRAMRTFAKKMTTRGEFGALATINVKAYAAALQLEEQIRKILGEPAGDAKPIPSPATSGAGPLPLHLVVKTPPTLTRQGCPIAVRAVVVEAVGQVSNVPGTSKTCPTIAQVTLSYRRFGEKEFRAAPMKLVFRKTYEGIIPEDAVTGDGIEFFVEAKDTAGSVACAPKGYPAVAPPRPRRKRLG